MAPAVYPGMSSCLRRPPPAADRPQGGPPSLDSVRVASTIARHPRSRNGSPRALRALKPPAAESLRARPAQLTGAFAKNPSTSAGSRARPPAAPPSHSNACVAAEMAASFLSLGNGQSRQRGNSNEIRGNILESTLCFFAGVSSAEIRRARRDGRPTPAVASARCQGPERVASAAHRSCRSALGAQPKIGSHALRSVWSKLVRQTLMPFSTRPSLSESESIVARTVNLKILFFVYQSPERIYQSSEL